MKKAKGLKEAAFALKACRSIQRRLSEAYGMEAPKDS